MSELEIVGGIIGILFGGGGGGGLLLHVWRSMRKDIRTAQAKIDALSVSQDARNVEFTQAQYQIKELKKADQQKTGMIALLKTDNEELRAIIAGLNKTTTEMCEQIDALENDKEKKDEEIARLKNQNHDLFEQNKRYSLTIEVQRKFAREMGRELRDSTEDKPAATLVTGAAGNEQIKQEN